jgi:hypothetical protein
MQSFRNLKVWEKAHVVTLDIYKTSRAFPKEELYGLTSQCVAHPLRSEPISLRDHAGKETLSLGGFSISRLGRRANLNTTSC